MQRSFFLAFGWLLFCPGLMGAPKAARMPASPPGQKDLPEGVLIEAEAFARKTPDTQEFAVPKKEATASAGVVLLKFYGKGSCAYDFVLPGDGDYAFWLRYASNNDVRIRAAVDSEKAKDFKTAPLSASGALEGPNAYKWGLILQAKLAAGKHTLILEAASLRPDCILISTSKEAPIVMTAAAKEPPKSLDEKTRTLLAKPIEPIRPDWLNGAGDYQLPEWYDQWRVCAHTRLGPPWHDKPVFLTAAHEFAKIGFHVFSRHIKSGQEGAWWPSKEGAIVDWAQDRNCAKEIIDEAHAAGLRLIAYNRHMEDAHMAEQHPDWVWVDWNGQPLKTNRGAIMCVNSPYSDYFLRRQIELVDMGADGFFYDEVHMPKTGCWCPFCRKKFKEETGLDHPAEADPNDPVWNKLIDFNNASIERNFLKYRQALHERNPQLVMLIGSHKYPQMIERHLTQRLFRIADSMKTEFSLPLRGEYTGKPGAKQSDNVKGLRPREPDARLALGYTLARDAADGRPAHIWAHGLLDARSAIFATAGMIAHGCIANLDNNEQHIPDIEKFKPAVDMGNRVSPGFAGTSPLRWALVHYAEAARDKCLPDATEAWKNVLYPMFGAYKALLRAHYPVGVITDSQLEEGLPADCRVLFLPAPDQLTDPMKAAVEAFKKRGGLVVAQRPQWEWHDEEGHEKATAAFMTEIKSAAAESPVHVAGGNETMHAASFVGKKENRLTVALANDFSWVRTGKPAQAQEAKEILEAARVPPPCKGVMVTLRGLGVPKKVTELVAGASLPWKDNGAAVEIAVPDFDAMAVVVAEF